MTVDTVAGIAIGMLVTAAAFAVVTRRSNQRRSAGLTSLGRLALAILVLVVMGAPLVMLARYLGYSSPLFAVSAAAIILGFVALLRPVFSWKLPRALQTVRPWERTGKVYRFLGVPLFGAAIRARPISYLNATVYLETHRDALPSLRSSILAAEGAHFWALVLTVPPLAYAVFRGWWASILWVIAFHIVLNAYPVFHLRYVRGRVECLIARAHLPATASTK